MKTSIKKILSTTGLPLIAASFLVCGLFSPAAVLADDNTNVANGSTGNANDQSYTLLEPLPCISGGSINCGTDNSGTNLVTQVSLTTYLQYAFNLLIALSAVAAVFMIVWGGFEYMISEIPGVKTDGLKKVQNALIGLVMVLASYLIMRTVNPDLVTPLVSNNTNNTDNNSANQVKANIAANAIKYANDNANNPDNTLYDNSSIY